MLLTLSSRYQKPIALAFLYLFILSSVPTLAAGRPFSNEGIRAAIVRNDSRAGLPYRPEYREIIATAPPVPDTVAHTLRKEEKKKVDIGGPSQPEMSGFKSVGADNMVDLFSGDFSYNIPLLDVGGYPVNIFYNSGITMDQEASWVGLGWNINPGTIMRNMRGLPDDFNGTDMITKTQYVKPDKTYGVNIGAKIEALGLDFLALKINKGIFYNNMRGLGLTAGISPVLSIGSLGGDSKAAPLNFGWSLQANSQSGGSQTFSMSLTEKTKGGNIGSLTSSIGYHSRAGLTALHIEAELKKSQLYQKMSGDKAVTSMQGGYMQTMGTSISFAYPSMTPSIGTKFYSENYSIDIGTGTELWSIFGNLRFGGYYTRKFIKPADYTVRKPAFGMLYMQKGNDDKNALLDFNRLNDGVYTPNSPVVAIPAYTYDVFSISGEGTGGSFRAYRGDLGFVADPLVETGAHSAQLGVDMGAGTLGKGGINAQLVLTPGSAGVWGTGNLAKKSMAFRESEGEYQSVYFKNPGEKAIPDTTYQHAIGGEDLVRLKMAGTGYGNPTLMPTFMRYGDNKQYRYGNDLSIAGDNALKKRDKRTQVISFLTAEEAARVGQLPKLPSVKNPYDTVNIVLGCNAGGVDSIRRWNSSDPNNYRKPHHISEIDVLGQDGRRYIYGIPVYNTRQVEVTFNKSGNQSTQLSSYNPATDNQPEQNGSKDGYVERQEIPAYAHSFLLTALVSPNYVDLKGDGITDDDLGDAIKFNYSKLDKPFKWRTPVGANSATFSEGLKTDVHDDKSHYVYGEREMWYLYSIESKNMIARFYVKNDRTDSRSVAGEDGAPDMGWGAQRLTKISLFTKADLLKKGAAARPVKTVHFEYDYSLCKNVPGTQGGTGKLTLKSIYFTYNGNNKAKKNKYRFHYPSAHNPDYDFTAVDRWGNYKPAVNASNVGLNPGNLLNPDFPYTDQERSRTDAYVKAWTMDSISLPSGAAIKVHYEADDYGYVQDRRAATMVTIRGFGDTGAPDGGMLNNNKLYRDKNYDYDFIYIDVPYAITASTPAAVKDQIRHWYLGNLAKSTQLFMKLAVKMPAGDFEMIPLYGTVADWGLVPGNQNKTIFIRMQKLESGYSPMVQYSLQFMKNMLPGQAYPAYDVSDAGGIKPVIKALGGVFHSFKEAFANGMKLFKEERKCQVAYTDKSFLRLTHPRAAKAGGGLRVKKVVIHDRWDKMTQKAGQPGMVPATYGQEYFYTKKEMIGSDYMTISSGVASWEPSIGGEENPHREMMTFFNKNKMGPYDYGSVELPLAEMFFPAPSVGYSRVEVRSIHRDTVKNAPGIQVTEFYTNREFPYKSSYTPLEEHDATDEYKTPPLMALLKIDIKKAVALSQGFKVDINDMNGRMKKQATYSPLNLNDPIAYTENFYNIIPAGDNIYRFNHYFPVLSRPDGVVETNLIGREIEVMTDFRQHKQQTISATLNFNLDVISGFVVPIPIPTFFAPITRETDTYRSASVLKVVNHYAMVDSVVVVDKGSMVSTKNMVYDAETGNPLLTRTNNEHNKPVYNFSYPAHWGYSGMGLAYKNIDITFPHLRFRHGRLETPINTALLESGDELYVLAANDHGPLKDAQCDGLPVPGNEYLPKSPANRIWAVYTGKAGATATPEFVFMDADGNPYTADDATVRIIRSGKRNVLDAGLGAITSLNNPVKTVNGVTRLVFETQTNVLQTTAAVYKDHWRVDNSYFRKDSAVNTVGWARLKYKEYEADTTALVYGIINGKGMLGLNYVDLAPTTIRASSYSPNSFSNYIDESWIRFNVKTNMLPANATFLSATLSLYGHLLSSWSSNAPMPASEHLEWGSFDNHSRNRNAVAVNGTGRNDIAVLGMKTSWPSNNTQWETLLTDPNQDLHDWQGIGYIPHAGNAAVNYLINGGVDRRISLPEAMVARMLRNASDPSNNDAFGFRLMQFRNSPNSRKTTDGETLSQCFFSDYQPGVAPGSKSSPKLGLYYYICGDTSYSTGAGPNDQFVNSIIKCKPFDTTYSFCHSVFAAGKSINPYVQGIWGNWRVDSSFVYYGARKETDPTVSNLDMRTAGAINNFNTFWNFNASGLQRNYAAADVWVWNSVVTQYNRKGYDIENKDPLGRFNAGLYGYNQQLPVAVTNNSRYREAMFDGFEDYGYESGSCTEGVCQPPRHAVIDNVVANLDSTQQHTGRYSLRVAPSSSISLTAPVIGTDSSDRLYSMRVKVDSVQVTDTVIMSQGNGLTARYYNHVNYERYDTRILCPGDVGATLAYTGVEYPYYNITSPKAGVNKLYYSVKWKGKLVPKTTGSYVFRASSDNGFRIKINGSYITNNAITYGGDCNAYKEVAGSFSSNSITLYRGQQYDIEIDHYNQWGEGYFAAFTWSINGGTAVPVDGSCFYSESYGSITVNYPYKWCIKLDSSQVRGNALTDVFAPVPGRKMVLSAWVKEGAAACRCSTYANNKIAVSFQGAAGTLNFQPAGSIIEGWQRYEAVFTIPPAATSMNVQLQNTGSQQVYFDDLRIHPFNANMKSFVYHSGNLRLMAELDENNYAGLYEYDDDGTLIRVKKETERGIKTITETRSALQKAND